MKKNTIADKAAEKTFNSKLIQESWQGHMEAFGPILEPAFAEDYQSRVHLTAALNLISNRKIKQGLEKLNALESKCVCDADWAAFYFFHAVAAELSSKPADIVSYYEKAAEFHHKFYLPYIKLARYAHFAADFDTAEGWYWKGIACLDGGALSQKEAQSLASAYSNLASCLTMMHRYEEAGTMLERSKAVVDRLPTRLATEAILYAAMGEGEKTEDILSLIQKQAPAYLEPTQDMTKQILSGTHAHFSALPIEEDKVAQFWTWFAAETVTEESLNAELSKVFSFMQRPLKAKIRDNTIIVRDFYVKALAIGYEMLAASAPDGIHLEITH